MIRGFGWLLVPTMLISGCLGGRVEHTDARGVGSVSVNHSSCPGTSAKAAVRGYYDAIIRHDTFGAKSCLMPYYLQQLDRVVDPDWDNIKSLRALKLKGALARYASLPGNVPARYARPYAAAQIDAEFIVRYYHVESSSNGLTIRFIYVVKQHRTSLWRIAAIGSGP